MYRTSDRGDCRYDPPILWFNVIFLLLVFFTELLPFAELVLVTTVFFHPILNISTVLLETRIPQCKIVKPKYSKFNLSSVYISP